MDNIRLSLNPLKLTGSRIITAPSASNKPKTYVAIPIEHFYVPADAPKPYLLLSMIPCPNAQYGDFMVKPFISGNDWEQMSQEDRQNVAIIGKGTFMHPAVNKAIRQDAEKVRVEDVDPTTLTPSGQQGASNGSAAMLQSAPSQGAALPPSSEVPATRFEVIEDGGNIFWLNSWNEAATFASQDNVKRTHIRFIENNIVKSSWRWDEAKITWIQNF